MQILVPLALQLGWGEMREKVNIERKDCHSGCKANIDREYCQRVSMVSDDCQAGCEANIDREYCQWMSMVRGDCQTGYEASQRLKAEWDKCQSGSEV